ncbi:MAG: cob(I)yrinic acid a,c-diamide adenosyltransferase [Parcubacteria group bacterium]|nr:cob(I)yrinic acid a,c-diamide adenosyltransferase [Parcubacteria group bacterium]
MIICITGNGKGKTTSSIGQAIRALGDGKKVLMVQFIKGPWKSGEDLFIEKFGKQISFDIKKTGLGFVGILGDKLPIEEHQKAAKKGVKLAQKEMLSNKWSLLILDEVHNALRLNLLKLSDVLDLISLLPGGMDLILTGRDAPKEIIDLSDIVSEIKEIKHPYMKGQKGEKGVEW